MEYDSETTMPLVTVVIPAYNAAEFIKESIESVLNQTYNNIELLVIDDGSTDNTKAIVLSYTQRVNYYFQENAGVSAARNTGILLSKGRFITCLDADDIMHQDKISQQIDFINTNPRVQIVFTDYMNFEKNITNEVSHFKSCNKLMNLFGSNNNSKMLESKDALEVMVEENFSLGSNPLFSKSCLNKVGLYDCLLSQGEDFEFHYRYIKQYPIGIVNKVLLNRRLHADNASKQLGKLFYKAGMSRQKILLYEENIILRTKIKRRLRNIYLDIASTVSSYDQFLSFAMSIYSLKYGISLKTVKMVCRSLRIHIN